MRESINEKRKRVARISLIIIIIDEIILTDLKMSFVR